MRCQIEQFAGPLDIQLQHVHARTAEMSDMVKETLDIITGSNEDLIRTSQNALSDLGFQDPLSQDLMRSVHEIHKLQQLLDYNEFDDTSLADIDPTIGTGEIHEQEADVVTLF